MKQAGVSRYSVENFLSQSTKKLRREPFCASLISVVQRNLPMRRVSRFSKEILLSHSNEKLRRGTFLRFTKFVVSKIFMDKRVGGGKEYHVNLSIFFCLTVSKKFVGELFYFLQIFWYQKNLHE